MSEEKNCKATLYLCTPLPMLKPGYNPFNRSGITAQTGHAFVGITDENGKEERWGFSPGESEAFENPMKMVTGCKGSFSFETRFTHYNEAIVYPITREQYDQAKTKIEELRQNKDKKYRLFSSNCSTVASSILRAAGVGTKCPIIKFSPHTLTMKKRALLAKRRIEVAFFKIKNNVRNLFGKEKAPDSVMLDKLRKKPMPVTIKEGTRASDYEEPLDTKRILNSLMTRKVKKEGLLSR